MKLLRIYIACFALLLLQACAKEEKLDTDTPIPGLGGDHWAPGPIDRWIYDSLTQSYNIAVKYKWDPFELALDKTLVPPREEKVVPVLSAIKEVWLENYSQVAGPHFIRQYAPKFFVLVGSYEYNTNTNTVTEGTAEGGRKVVLYNLNNFRYRGMPGYNPTTDSAVVKRMFHVINHEFGHILNQNRIYAEDYKRVTAGHYIATWYNVSMAEARRDGFITNYAMGSADEDFVEMVATLLVEGKAGFDRILNGISGTSTNGTTAAQAREKLRTKEALVVAYFRDVWNVDFYALAAASRNAIENIIK